MENVRFTLEILGGVMICVTLIKIFFWKIKTYKVKARGFLSWEEAQQFLTKIIFNTLPKEEWDSAKWHDREFNIAETFPGGQISDDSVGIVNVGIFYYVIRDDNSMKLITHMRAYKGIYML